MAIENQAAVRGTHRTHHHAASASKTASGEDSGPASAFSALLGAAADDSDALDTGLAATSTATGTDTASAAGDVPTGKGRKLVPADGSSGGDAAALAAWAGLLQPPAVPLAPTVAAPAATAIGTTLAGGPVAVAGRVARPSDFSAPSAAGSPTQGAGAQTQAGALLQVDGKPPGRTAAANAAAISASPASPANSALVNTSATTASASATVPAESLTAAAQPGAAPAQVPAALPMAGHQLAPAASLRPPAVSTQTAVGRAHAATVAADAASSQAASLTAGVGGIAVSGTDAVTGRGASSTVSMGEGGQGRWAGMLSDIVRPIQSEGGTGGFAGSASQGQERGHQGESRGADGSGTGINALGFAPAAGASDGSGSFAAPTVGPDGQPVAPGTVMTPDEWLAATTTSINPRSLQTAELTVDAFGAPVDVKISLNGSEAEVAFHSDQADTRALLGGAVSDLQNLLQQEGLMLSGVSVGGSNAGQAGHAQGFSGDASQGGNRTRGGEPVRITPDVASVAPVAVASARSAAATARGGLDLFA